MWLTIDEGEEVYVEALSAVDVSKLRLPELKADTEARSLLQHKHRKIHKHSHKNKHKLKNRDWSLLDGHKAKARAKV